MNYTLQLHSSHQVFPVPRGLHDLMADIAKEVLRRHPRDIEPFIAVYLGALVSTREEVKGLTEEVDNEMALLARRKAIVDQYGLTEDEANYYTTRIQALFRGWKIRFAIKKYLTFKGKVPEKKNPYLTPITERLSYRKASAAATKIQAAFKGYIARKSKLFALHTGDAWRPDWLWTEFNMTNDDIKKIHQIIEAKRKIKEDLRLVCIPKRYMEEVQAHLADTSHGKVGDYDEEMDMEAPETIRLVEEDLETLGEGYSADSSKKSDWRDIINEDVEYLSENWPEEDEPGKEANSDMINEEVESEIWQKEDEPGKEANDDGGENESIKGEYVVDDLVPAKEELLEERKGKGSQESLTIKTKGEDDFDFETITENLGSVTDTGEE